MVGAACLIGAGFGFTPEDPTSFSFCCYWAVSKLFVTLHYRGALDEPAFNTLLFAVLMWKARFDIK